MYRSSGPADVFSRFAARPSRTRLFPGGPPALGLSAETPRSARVSRPRRSPAATKKSFLDWPEKALDYDHMYTSILIGAIYARRSGMPGVPQRGNLGQPGQVERPCRVRGGGVGRPARARQPRASEVPACRDERRPGLKAFHSHKYAPTGQNKWMVCDGQATISPRWGLGISIGSSAQGGAALALGWHRLPRWGTEVLSRWGTRQGPIRHPHPNPLPSRERRPN